MLIFFIVCLLSSQQSFSECLYKMAENSGKMGDVISLKRLVLFDQQSKDIQLQTEKRSKIHTSDKLEPKDLGAIFDEMFNFLF